jgi:hypothetical protein
MIANHAYEQIQALDLEPIKFKLMHAASGEAWSYHKVQAVEFEYRRFLYMIKMYPDEQLAPVEDVDTFWHYHILDTMKYAADCDALFGHFVHHYPYAGMAGDDDELAMVENADRTRDLYQRTFASPYPGAQPDGQAGAVAANPADGVEGAKAAYCVRATTPAYCVEMPKPAYCVVAAKPAYCVLGLKPDHSELAAKPAYCVLTKPDHSDLAAKPAYCVLTKRADPDLVAKPAYCVLTTKPADSELAAKPAYCVLTTKPADFELSSNLAYCVVAGKPVLSGLAVKPAYYVRAAKPANNAVN